MYPQAGYTYLTPRSVCMYAQHHCAIRNGWLACGANGWVMSPS